MLRQCEYAIAVIGMLLLSIVAQADPLPGKDSSSAFSTQYGLGYSSGTLYLFSGDTLYSTDLTNRGNPVFTTVGSNIENDFTTNTPRAYEGSFATNANGQALISFGTSGGVLKSDLGTTPVSNTEVSDFDTSNIFSTALRNDGTGFGMYVASDYSTTTAIYVIDAVTGDTQLMADPGGVSSGGLAFDNAGNLYVGTFNYNTYPYPDPRGEASYYRYDAADIAAWEAGGDAPTATPLANGITNGNGTIVVGVDGNLYFNTSTGIGKVNLVTGTVSNFYGDIDDEDLYDYGDTQPLNGLAVDPDTGELVFAEYDEVNGEYNLTFLAVPEPVTAATLLLGLAGVLTRRHRRMRMC